MVERILHPTDDSFVALLILPSMLMKQIGFLEQCAGKIKTCARSGLTSLALFVNCWCYAPPRHHRVFQYWYRPGVIDHYWCLEPTFYQPVQKRKSKKKKIDRVDHSAEISVVQINTSKLPLPWRRVGIRISPSCSSLLLDPTAVSESHDGTYLRMYRRLGSCRLIELSSFQFDTEISGENSDEKSWWLNIEKHARALLRSGPRFVSEQDRTVDLWEPLFVATNLYDLPKCRPWRLRCFSVLTQVNRTVKNEIERKRPLLCSLSLFIGITHRGRLTLSGFFSLPESEKWRDCSIETSTHGKKYNRLDGIFGNARTFNYVARMKY